MTIADILIILATALSPLIAVQVTRRLDDRNEERGRKLDVFKTLMTTRAYSVSPAHVQALNRIDLEFSRKKKAEKEVLEVWQQYLDHLGRNVEEPSWGPRREELFVNLLHAMAKALNYDFSKTDIRNTAYSPKAHGQLEEEQQLIRMRVLEVLEGRRALAMHVVSLTAIPQPTATEEQEQPRVS
jgi:predicted nucleotidyltransferase